MVGPLTKRVVLAIAAMGAVAALGLGWWRGEEKARECRRLADGIVETWFTNGPVLPPDIERERRFRELRCSPALLQDAKERRL